MSKLQYLTRGSASPQGKPRVYFCSHPKEQEFFLQPISKQILKLQNCVIWYDPEPEIPDNWEELSADLSQMQLFVMPVTERLLTQPNRAMDKEFPFAVEHHIPVLPLMQESGLEEKFQKRFGNLQFLDANAHDSTAIPFEEKLQKFLNSILIGDELAQKVRAAFDAYIFLSYRKKDRREAQKLMRLIHQNEFCRDIAIWYDEFLVPGENFNQAIADALQKSKLFTLVVTPSLLENPNYVMTTEYPMAQKSGKPILPVEMTPTSRPALESCYESVPPCTNGEDAPALSQSLLDALRQLAIRENDNDPQHNYFIGLAYLAGVDVEVDNQRAEALIRSAAEQGYDPAMEKLVLMYRSGEGVAQNYQKAIDWQKKLIESREKAWGKSRTEDTFLDLTDALWDLGNYYKELEDIPNWRWVWESKMLPLCKTVWEEYHFPDANRGISISYHKLGNILEAEEDLQAARKFYQLSMEIFKQLVETSPTMENCQGLSVNYSKLGDISKAQGNIQAAKKFHQLSMGICKQMVEESPVMKNRRSLSISYERMGDISQAEGDLISARKYYQLDLDIIKGIVEESPTIQNHHSLSIGYERLGDISQAEGDLKAARQFYQLDLEIVKQLYEEFGTITNRRNLSICYDRLGEVCETEGNLTSARQFYQLSLNLFKQLSEESPTIENRRNLSIGYYKLGEVCQLQGDLSSARRFYEKSLQVSKQIAKESPTIENRENLSECYGRMGDICWMEGNLLCARHFFELCHKILQPLTEKFPNLENRRNLSICCERLGDISQANGNLSSANEFFRQSLDIRKQLAKESHTPESKEDLALCYYKIGTLKRPFFRSRSYLKTAFYIWKKLAEEYPSIPRYLKNRDVACAALKKRGK